MRLVALIHARVMHPQVLAFIPVFARLMMSSLHLSAHGIRHQSTSEMFASLSRDTHGAGTANIHAGSALLTSGGICMLGDLGAYKKERLDAIQSGRAPK